MPRRLACERAALRRSGPARSSTVRQYRVRCDRAETSDASLCYYRDDYGLEVDAIIELTDGRWAAIEIKLSEDKVQKGVDSLMRLKKKAQQNPAARNHDPEFLAVLVGRTSMARRTPEGVYVVPATCLTA